MYRIHFEENDELLDICFDNVFKAVFTKEIPAAKGALSKLISALIDKEVSVSVITANEQPVDNIRDRQIRFDIKCKTESGELVNVEMSLNPKPFEPVRLEFYAGKLFTGQDIRGIGKNYEDLKEAYQIAILAKESFFPDEEFLHTFEYYDFVHRMSLNGKSSIITLELSKLEKIIEKPVNEMDGKESWAVYFRYLTDKDKRYKINEILEQEEGIAMASEVLIHISKDEIEQARLESELKYELDTQSNLSWAKREGYLEGEEKGHLEEKQKVIDLLKSGKSLEEIISAYDT